MPFLTRLLGTLLLAAALGACDTTTAEEHYRNALGYLAEQEVRTAVIELKNALQKSPDMAEARLALGEAHALLGDYPSALKEFERALDLGLDTERVRVGLARAKVRLGRHQEVIGELADAGTLPPPLAVALADAYLLGGETDKAAALYRQGVTLADGHLGLGLIALGRGDLARAENHFAQAVTLDPNHREAWLRKAEFELAQGRFEAAEQSFTTARELPGGNVMARMGLARVHLLQGDLEAAGAEVAEGLRLAPQFPLAHYIDGLIKYERQDIDGAEAALREVQRTVPDHPPSLYLMGAVKYRQGQLSQASDNLGRYLARDPGNESARKLLAAVQYDQGNLGDVAETLAPVVDSTGDPQILAMYGAARLRQGDATAATQAFERAVALAPDSAPFRNQLAVGLLSAGDEQGAMAQLESAVAVDGSQFQSDYLMALLHLRDRNFTEAGRAVDAMVAKSPELPLGYNLQGAVALAEDRPDDAYAAFEAALARDPEFWPAVANLNRLDQQRGQPARAEARLRALLERQPDNENVLLALAERALRDGREEEARDLLQRAVASSGGLRSYVALLRLELLKNRLDQAADLAERALAAFPRVADVNLLAAEVALRQGDTGAAERLAIELQTFVTQNPENVALRAAVGTVQFRVGDFTLARRNLEAVVELSDEPQVGALRGLARLDLADGDIAAARRRVDALVAAGDAGPAFDLLEADVLLAEGDADAAIDRYRALADADVREGALRLAMVQLQRNDASTAIAGLERWIARHEGDVGAQLLLADGLMRQADKSRAVRTYEGLVATENPVVLNNLAWLYMERGDARALETARRALAAAPDNPDIADTLGWILLQNGQAGEALGYLKRSAQLKPDNPSVQYHLGVAYRANGDAAAARQSLERAVSLGEFPEREAAEAALAELADA